MGCDYNELVTTIKDIVLALCAIASTCIAYKALSTWNRQLKGQVEYELTRRILKCTYKLREEFNVVRNPDYSTEEQKIPEQLQIDSSFMSEKHKNFRHTVHIFEKRWNKVIEIKSELNTELLEAEALWGREIYNIFQLFFKLENELIENINKFLMSHNPSASEDLKKYTMQGSKNRFVLVYDPFSQTPNEFSVDVEEAIKNIVNYLQPYLKK
ncbi:MAG: hypothetical protein V4525_11870 [Pseudomonadota bacterium]